MTRVVIKKAKSPHEIKSETGSKWICMCGLSQNQPFCDTSHKKTSDEEDTGVYLYTKDGSRKKCNCQDCENLNTG